MKNTRYFVLAALVVVATLLRLAPLPANFSPIAAIALFAGAMFVKHRWVGPIVPLIALILSDLVIGFHATQPFVYGSYVLIALLGRGLMNNENEDAPKTKTQWFAIGLSSFAASAVFFLVSNFGVWVEGLLYPRTGAGLVACYFAAVPFFWNTLVGDLAFTFGLFGAWALATKALPQVRAVSGR